MGVKVDGCENVDGHDEAMIMIRIRHSQHQYCDAARGPGAEPPASPASVLKLWVSEANPAHRHRFMACHTIIREWCMCVCS